VTINNTGSHQDALFWRNWAEKRADELAHVEKLNVTIAQILHIQIVSSDWLLCGLYLSVHADFRSQSDGMAGKVAFFRAVLDAVLVRARFRQLRMGIGGHQTFETSFERSSVA